LKPIEEEWSMAVKLSRRDANKFLIGLPAYAMESKLSNTLMPTEEPKISAADPYPRNCIAVLDTDARHIDASNGKLAGKVTGEVEAEDGVLIIRRIHVAMRLVAPEETLETVERVHGIYAMRCPLYRTLHKTIQLTSSFTLEARGLTQQH
jgi:hypothetical protein